MNFTLTVPEEVYSRARRIADETSRPIEQILLEHLQTLPDPLPTLPPDEQEELDALKHLSDDALWTFAREQMPQDIQERMQVLMDKNSHGTISDEEYAELSTNVERGNRLMVRKAEAAHLLTERGYDFSQSDFRASE
ncbi:MAG: hypothetical protein ABI690_26960 [Chloroflexota bacterium]